MEFINSVGRDKILLHTVKEVSPEGHIMFFIEYKGNTYVGAAWDKCIGMLPGIEGIEPIVEYASMWLLMPKDRLKTSNRQYTYEGYEGNEWTRIIEGYIKNNQVELEWVITV